MNHTSRFGLLQPPPFGLLTPVMMSTERHKFLITPHTSYAPERSSP